MSLDLRTPTARVALRENCAPNLEPSRSPWRSLWGTRETSRKRQSNVKYALTKLTLLPGFVTERHYQFLTNWIAVSLTGKRIYRDNIYNINISILYICCFYILLSYLTTLIYLPTFCLRVRDDITRISGRLSVFSFPTPAPPARKESA